MRKKIIDTLLDLGIPAGVLGFGYIVDAIELIHEKEWRDGKIIVLYYEIGKKNNTTASKVERAIRWAFESAFRSNNSEKLKKYLGTQEHTNSNLLHALYYKISEE